MYVGTSLDGFIARPDGAIDWMGEPPTGGEDYGWAEFKATIDGIVLGRVTFDKLLTFDHWSYGSLPVTVLSTTMKSVPDGLPGKVEVSSLPPHELLRRLAERGQKRVYVDGGKTIHGFLREGLIDELIVTTLPVLIGRGIPLFPPLDHDAAWELVFTKTYTGGLVKSAYRRLEPRP